MGELIDRIRSSLADRYDVEREIGRGGMAVVFLARDLQLGRQVAIKVIRPELAQAVGIERFVREVRIEAALDHPNIVALYDSGEADGLPYYVMPYVPGESLRARLDRENRLSLTEVTRITRCVAEGLSYAHAHGVIHKDIKPENILLSDERVLIADFGIAKATEEAGGTTLTTYGIVLGTPEYMSPEQATGETIDSRSDIYALGCVVFEMLGGDPPFTGKTRSAIIAKHIQERVPSLHVVRQNVPRDMVKAVERALAKVPGDRFASAVEFNRTLEAGKDSDPYGTGLWDRAGPRAKGLALLAAVAVIVVGTWVLWPRSSLQLDDNRVILFPMRETGLINLPGGIGFRAALRVGSALEQTDPLRFEWGWPWLDEPARQDIRRLSATAADSLARIRNARYRIDAEVVEQGAAVDVVLWLHDVAADSVVVQRTVSGPLHADSVLQLTLRAAAQLLPFIIVEPSKTMDTVAFMEHDIAAGALWMQGEEEYRRSRFADALEFYRRAIEQDSSLAMAALKGAQAASWMHSADDVDPLIAVALAGASSLPERHSLYANGIRFWHAGNADSAISSLTRALALDSTWSDAWMALGEVYYHFVTAEPGVDSLAGDAFARALRHDPAFTPAVIHLTEQTIRRGEIDSAQALIERLDTSNAASGRVASFRLMLECVEDGNDRVDWSSLAEVDPQFVLARAVVLGTAGAQPDCAAAAYGAVLWSAATTTPQRWGAWLSLQSLLLAQGRFDDLIRALDTLPDDLTMSAEAMLMMDVHAGAPFEQRANEIGRQRCGDPSATSTPVLWLCTLWASHRDSLELLRAIEDAMSLRLTPPSSRRDSLVADMAASYAALGAGDSSLAIDRLSALKTSAQSADLQWQPWESLGAERMVLSRLLLARGEYEAAHRVASAFDNPQAVVYLAYLAQSLALRERAATAMGWKELAAGYRKRLAELQSH